MFHNKDIWNKFILHTKNKCNIPIEWHTFMEKNALQLLWQYTGMA